MIRSEVFQFKIPACGDHRGVVGAEGKIRKVNLQMLRRGFYLKGFAQTTVGGDTNHNTSERRRWV